MNNRIIIQLTSMTFSRSELEAGLSLIRAFFPGVKVRIEDIEDIQAIRADEEFETITVIEMDLTFSDTSQSVRGNFYYAPVRTQIQPQTLAQTQDKAYKPSETDEMTLSPQGVRRVLAHPQVGKETERKLLLKHGILHLLAQVTGHMPPWGILTGIRPSKILHHLKDLATPEVQAEKVLRERYSIREDKIHLLEEIVALQRPYLEEITEHPEQVAVYVGIPFCPTRCTYCSFPAYSLQQGREPLRAYLEELYEEVRVTGRWMKETGLCSASLYIGGGTPTILTTSEIADLLRWIRKNIPMVGDIELSVEAGRPDTLSKEKLQALQEQGVNRLSINPQTMHDRTLQRIGRAHSVEDILKIYETARKISGWIINMDLILGLPGETVEDIFESLKQIGKLKPDNLTVHALAIKRGSKEHESGLAQNMSSELETMQEMVLSSARSFGMHPYYLYRQKQIAGNLENIGFARPGAECRYNIGIMEERQSVIGIGAGASSKVVDPEDYSLINLQHPSNWQVYREQWKELHEKRVSKFGFLEHGTLQK